MCIDWAPGGLESRFISPKARGFRLACTGMSSVLGKSATFPLISSNLKMIIKLAFILDQFYYREIIILMVD